MNRSAESRGFGGDLRRFRVHMRSLNLGSNSAALKAQRELARSTQALSKNTERLSTGLRINRACDDAAGLAVSDQLRADAKLYATALRNVNDGISVMNIVDSALESQQNVVMRLAELAEQAANGTISNKQREAISVEYQALVEEFGRIAESCSFNGVDLLSGERGNTRGSIAFQAGISGNSAEMLTFSSPDSAALSGTIAMTDFLRSGDDDNDFDLLDQINLFSHPPLSSFQELTEFLKNAPVARIDVTLEGQRREFAVVFAVAFTGAVGGSDPLPIAPNELQVLTYERLEGSDSWRITDLSTLDIDPATRSIKAPYTFSSLFGEVTFDLRGLYFAHPNSGSGATSIDISGIETKERAKKALEITQARVQELALLRGQAGAVRSRLEVASNMVSVSKENSAAAESRIRDVDVAAEAAQLSRNKILQQVGIEVLALTHRQSELALDLLK